MQKHQKLSFTCDEDKKLTTLYYLFNGQWKIISEVLRSKTPRQCRDRWIFYLSPFCKNTTFSEEDFKQLFFLVNQYGHKWRLIGIQMNKTPNQVKNAWKKIIHHKCI